MVSGFSKVNALMGNYLILQKVSDKVLLAVFSMTSFSIKNSHVKDAVLRVDMIEGARSLMLNDVRLRL
jgi:hypothetical protein